MYSSHKYDAVIRYVEDGIRSGKFKLCSRLPSLKSLQIKFNLSRCSVFQAMEILRSRGIVESEPAVGYFVANTDIRTKKRVLLIFGEMNAFKNDLYNSILDNLEPDVETNIAFHYRDKRRFFDLVEDASGKYTDIVVMPGTMDDLLPLLSSVKGRVFLLDHFNANLIGRFPSVGQDFEQDTYDALVQLLPRIRKYKSIILVQNHPMEPISRYDGLKRFGTKYGFPTILAPDLKTLGICRDILYVVPNDTELVTVIRQTRESGLKIGRDFGIISFNECDLKEVLEGGITTITTDFNQMGKTLAGMINNDSEMGIQNIHNPWKLEIRDSI